MVVGSAADAGLRIRSRSLSSEHAAFDIDENGKVVVLNLGGPGCVRVGEVAVEHAEVRHGDVVDLGPVQIRIEVRKGLAAADPVPVLPAPAPRPADRPDPDAGPFLLLTTDDGGEECFELPVGRTTVGSGPCAIRVHDPTVAAIKGEWFCSPDRSVYYQAHPRGAVVRCEEWRSEVAGPVTMRLVFSERSAGSLGSGDGPVSAKQARERELAAVRQLAKHVTVNFAAAPPEALFEPDPLAPESKALRAAHVSISSSPSLPAVPAVLPASGTLPPQQTFTRRRSAWAFAPALIVAGLMVGAGGRLLAGTDAGPPVATDAETVVVRSAALGLPDAEPEQPTDSRLIPGLVSFVELGGTSAETRHTVHSTIWKNRRAHATCFAPYLAAQPDAGGVLWVTVALGGDGRIRDGWAEPESTIESDAAVDCLVAYLGDLTLPSPPSPPLVVSIPFRLQGGQLAVPTPPSRVAARPL